MYYGTQKEGNTINDVVKINFSNPNELTSYVYTPTTDYVNSFEVDDNGNLFYTASMGNDYVKRVKKANGSIQNLSDDFYCYWKGLDGNIYYSTNGQIKKITIDSSYNLTETVYGNLSVGGGYLITIKKRIYIIGGGISEVYNETDTPRAVELQSLNINKIKAVSSTENFYYVAGADTSNNMFLIKVNPVDDSYTHLLTQNDYDVYAFTASETDGVIFNALRMSDGKKVIGKVGINGGTVTMLDEESDVQISYLERIN